jgi:hypothetical protein
MIIVLYALFTSVYSKLTRLVQKVYYIDKILAIEEMSKLKRNSN